MLKHVEALMIKDEVCDVRRGSRVVYEAINRGDC